MVLAVRISDIPDSTKNNKNEVRCHSANYYHKSVWGDYFLRCSSSDKDEDIDTERRLQELKERVKNMLVENEDDQAKKLNLIDVIQRLNVSYHFDNEIGAALQTIYETTYPNDHYKGHGDLYIISLSFRLLRQQGYFVSSDTFGKFKDSSGKFKETLISDVRGMLSLYEATHLRVQGEDILDEALDFTINQLNYVLPNLTDPLKEQVNHALKQPIWTGLVRIEARAYISFYEKEDSHDKILLEFAKLNFNKLQKMHQKELSEITRWWIDLDFANKLSYARDRVVECYFWILGVYFEPEHALARRIMTKVIAMTSVIDDTYDSYGTIEELELFTDAVDRLDVTATDQLPEYMQICYKALLDVYVMIEEQMSNQGRSYRVHYAKEAMKDIVKAYYEEAKWCNKKYVPTYEEYMKVAMVTSGYRILATTSFVGMGDVVTEEAFKWVSNDPLIVRASSIITRLQDDMVGHKFEQKREHVASAIECYMKQHGASEEESIFEFRKQVTSAWKDINAEFLRPTRVPMPLIMRVLNLARVIYVLYKDEDAYTHSETKFKDFVKTVLINPVPT